MTIYKTYTKLNGIAAKVPYTDIKCKLCGSKNIIRYGTFRGIQRFFCKDCQRKFADNDALSEMQTPTEQVGAALSMYYEGHSLNKVRRLLSQIYNSYPSDSSVYRWLTRFTKQAVQEIKEYQPKVGDTWVADETMLDMVRISDQIGRLHGANRPPCRSKSATTG